MIGARTGTVAAGDADVVASAKAGVRRYRDPRVSMPSLPHRRLAPAERSALGEPAIARLVPSTGASITVRVLTSRLTSAIEFIMWIAYSWCIRSTATPCTRRLFDHRAAPDHIVANTMQETRSRLVETIAKGWISSMPHMG